MCSARVERVRIRCRLVDSALMTPFEILVVVVLVLLALVLFKMLIR